MKSFIFQISCLILLQLLLVIDVRVGVTVSASTVLENEVDIPVIFKRKHLIEYNEKGNNNQF